MGIYHIFGKNKLMGELSIGGCKNAILPILAATVLSGKKSIIHNCPTILDTYTSIEILKHIGADVEYDGYTIIVDSSKINLSSLPKNSALNMRSSVVFLGALLSRFNVASSFYPGGCKLGKRPIDLHLKGFEALNITVNEHEDKIICKTDILKGNDIALDFPSVGATQNIMLAATLANGKTTIINAAKEPEIIDLQNFLICLGADISGAGSKKITINGVKNLKEAEYTIMPDRIVAGTYLTAAAITQGSIKLNKVNTHDLKAVITKLEQAGSQITQHKDAISIKAANVIKAVDIKTSPFPGFPTDMQPQFSSFLTLAKGESFVNETIFESRDNHLKELKKMGANIKITTNNFYIKGVKELYGTVVNAKDLRGGAALILAALAAKGQSIIYDNNYIMRGYENIERDLSKLGADIKYHRENIIEEKELSAASK